MYNNVIHLDAIPHTQVWLTTVQGCSFGLHNEAAVTDILKIINVFLLDRNRQL